MSPRMTDPAKAVFLSYASQDTEAAARLCQALRSAGFEVWFDRSELRGGDAWDQEIRQQIRTCALFVPLISANTRARTEGYFRLEWKLAIDRSHLMAPNRAFLVPVVIDGAATADATVPERFSEVQWTLLPGGEATPEFVKRIAHLLQGVSEMTSTEQEPVGGVAGMPASAPAPSPTRIGAEWTGSRRVVAGAIVVALALVGGTTWWYHRTPVPKAVVPYSAEDERMSFAVLPIEAPPGDSFATELARMSTDDLYSAVDRNVLWARLARASEVTVALRQSSAPRELARALHVHFLLRGSVVRDAAGYTLTLHTVDGLSERSLGTKSLSTPTAAIRPGWSDDIAEASYLLGRFGLEEEVRRAEPLPEASLDVRDLAFRAFDDWGHERMADNPKGAYNTASRLLQRALSLSPNDALALWLSAHINLCDCVMSWSQNPAEQQAIGEAALDRYLALRPDDAGMLVAKGHLYALRGRRAEQVSVLDDALRLEPRYNEAVLEKGEALVVLGRAREALDTVRSVADRRPDDPAVASQLADIQYALGNYADAEQLARRAVARGTREQRTNPLAGAVRLTLIAAAGQVHDLATAKSALADLQADLPTLTSLAAVRAWMSPLAALKGYDSLFEGLRRAGLP